MSVYVDGLKPSIKNKNWKYNKSCHMVADSLEDLHAFARKINMPMLWFQNRLGMPHYDLTEGKRSEAVKAGAIEINDVQLVSMLCKSRATVSVKNNPIRHDMCDTEGILSDVPKIEICNLRTEKPQYPWDVKVCRRSSLLGNPFIMLNESDRDKVCDDYIKWITEQLAPGGKDRKVIEELLHLQKLYEQHGKLRLFCWCAPKRCHAETIKSLIEGKDIAVPTVQTESGEVDITGVMCAFCKKKQATIIQGVFGFCSEEHQIKYNQGTLKEMEVSQNRNYEDLTIELPVALINQVSQGLPVIGFDTETERITYQNPVPSLICMTYSNTSDLKGAIKTPWEHRIDQHFIEMYTNGQHSVGHNTAFDLSILAFQYPDLLPYIFDALDRGLIHDTLLREKLLMLTLHGNFEMIERNGCNVRLGYKLTDLEMKYLKINRTDQKDNEDAPRLHYNIYKNVPVAEWDKPFIDYAIDDAVNTGHIYDAQEIERQKCIETRGLDPFIVETFRVKISFALRLLECVGSRMDPEMVLEVSKRFRTEYAQPRLRSPLLAAGLLVDPIPPQPYSKGTLAHTAVCEARKINTDQKKMRKDKTCGCPPKMKKGEPEHNPTKPLFQYIWNLAYHNPEIKAWPSDGCASDMRKTDVYKVAVEGKAFRPEIIAGTEVGGVAILPDDIKLKTDEVWSSTFSALDPLLTIWAERKALRKIITDYLPKMYYMDENGVETPATIIRGSFYPLCLTGRSSSSASKLYPSRNEQNVDPRVRPCTIPRDGMILVSTDYSGMELGTLAQKCVSLFGHSVMADNINAGIDNHAFLAAQIAFAMDVNFNRLVMENGLQNKKDAIYDTFKEFKDRKDECIYPTFCDSYREKYRQDESKELDRPILWSDFWVYYRTLAKPTGLGFPGGLGAATMVSFAKGRFKVVLTLDIAKQIREVWKETYPEMPLYLDWVNKQCKDPHHLPIEIEDDDGTIKKQTFYAYDTPRGMHRARCGYCEAANGAALQAFSAEGALEALYRVQKAMWLAGYDGPLDNISNFLDSVDPDNLLQNSYPINFLHDEIIWETPVDMSRGTTTGKCVTEGVVDVVENIMVVAMQEITPDVRAGVESAAMLRWYKAAEEIRDGHNNLIPWSPEHEKKGV